MLCKFVGLEYKRSKNIQIAILDRPQRCRPVNNNTLAAAHGTALPAIWRKDT
jgi:hypothetical protein